MNRLADRKRLLVLEAELQRRLIAADCLELKHRTSGVRAGIAANRWWLLAGGLGGGLLLVRHWRTVAQWLPTVLSVWRIGGRARD